MRGPSHHFGQGCPTAIFPRPARRLLWKSLSCSGVTPTTSLANSGYVGKLRVRPRNFLCSVSLLRCGPGQVGVDERVEDMSGKPPTRLLLLADVNQVDHVAPVHPLVEPHGGGSLFDELHKASGKLDVL
jgi:hypothetical protein